MIVSFINRQNMILYNISEFHWLKLMIRLLSIELKLSIRFWLPSYSYTGCVVHWPFGVQTKNYNNQFPSGLRSTIHKLLFYFHVSSFASCSPNNIKLSLNHRITRCPTHMSFFLLLIIMGNWSLILSTEHWRAVFAVINH